MTTSERHDPSIPLPGPARPDVKEREGARGDVVPGRRARDGGRLGPAVLALVALLVGVAVGAGGATLLGRDSADPFGGAVDDSRYQAVILSNDKVYFGRIRALNGDFYHLRNAFFLRETRDRPDAEPVRALLPVNREIHAPDNSMLIRRDEVVLVENLGKDSPILREIRRQLGDGK